MVENLVVDRYLANRTYLFINVELFKVYYHLGNRVNDELSRIWRYN